LVGRSLPAAPEEMVFSAGISVSSRGYRWRSWIKLTMDRDLVSGAATLLTFGPLISPLMRRPAEALSRIGVTRPNPDVGLDTVGGEPEIDVVDVYDAAGAAEHRERIERARTEAYRRYRDHLAAVFDRHGAPQPDALADTRARGTLIGLVHRVRCPTFSTRPVGRRCPTGLRDPGRRPRHRGDSWSSMPRGCF
jgi:hypothetical protein